VDVTTGEIAAHVLTDGYADDAVQVPTLLGQPESQITPVTADGAYDGEPTYAAAAARQHDPRPDVIIPPRTSAVMSTEDPDMGRPSMLLARTVYDATKISAHVGGRCAAMFEGTFSLC